MKKLTILESLRGFASIYVAIGHFVLSLKYIPSYLSFFFRFGQEAVIIFFILSGFVIYYSSMKHPGETLTSYFIKRFRRIYFPLICAICVSIVFVSSSFSVKQLLGNLLMLQDFETGKPGNIVNPFLGNAPLWSLSYEWTFYLLFPFVFPVIKDNKNRVHIIGFSSIIFLLIYILFPNHIFLVLAYFMIWWTGLEIASYFLSSNDKANINSLIFYYVVALILVGVVCTINLKNEHVIKIGIYPYLVLRHYLFALTCLVCSIYATSFTKKVASLIKPFALIAPISYGIYIIHYPILVQSHFQIQPLLELVIKVMLVVGLSYIIEKILQPRINKLLNYI